MLFQGSLKAGDNPDLFSHRPKIRRKMHDYARLEFISKNYQKHGEDSDKEEESFVGTRKSFIPTLGMRQWWNQIKNVFFTLISMKLLNTR